MRVLQLGPYPPPWGGVQANVVAIRQYLQSQESYCAVVNLTRYRRADGDDIFYPHSPLGVASLLLRLRYDLIHIQFGGKITLRLLTLWLACTLLPGKKTVLTFHSGGYASWPEGKSARPATLRGFIFRRLDRIITVNQEMSELFRRFGVPAERIRLIPPHAFFDQPSEHLSPQIANFFAAHAPVLVTVSGLEPEYDITLQIDVLGDLFAKYPRAGLLICGGGSLEQQIRERIRSKAYASHIRLCGDIPHEETLRVIKESRIMLRTSHYDGDSVAVREALHLGTPVIATDNGMRPSGVHLIAVADREGCRAMIERILESPPRRQPQEQTPAENITAVIDLYRELLH